MEDHIYEDPDLEPSSSHTMIGSTTSYKPIQPASDLKSRGKSEKKQKQKQTAKGLGILKNLRKKDKQQVSVGSGSVQSTAPSGKNFRKGYSASHSKQVSSERNYYIKEGKRVASSRSCNKEQVTLKHKKHSAPRSKVDQDETAGYDSSPSPPPPLPNRKYLLDTAFIAELESFPTEPDDEEAPSLPERYYEDDPSLFPDAHYEDIDYMEGNSTRGNVDEEGYVDVPRNSVYSGSDGEESDEYIEAEVRHDRNIEAESGDESDEYIEPELHHHQQDIGYINVARNKYEIDASDDDDYINLP